jgi:hypothetical protein
MIQHRHRRRRRRRHRRRLPTGRLCQIKPTANDARHSRRPHRFPIASPPLKPHAPRIYFRFAATLCISCDLNIRFVAFWRSPAAALVPIESAWSIGSSPRRDSVATRARTNIAGLFCCVCVCVRCLFFSDNFSFGVGEFNPLSPFKTPQPHKPARRRLTDTTKADATITATTSSSNPTTTAEQQVPSTLANDIAINTHTPLIAGLPDDVLIVDSRATQWTRDEDRALLTHAKRHGLWPAPPARPRALFDTTSNNNNNDDAVRFDVWRLCDSDVIDIERRQPHLMCVRYHKLKHLLLAKQRRASASNTQ